MKFFKAPKYITREDNNTYLIRWNLFECRWFSLKIHKILLSDHDCLHDHPWAFITFLMKGGYVEYYEDTSHCSIDEPYPIVSRVRSRFSLLYRPARFTHRLEIHQPVWSLVLTFKKERQWGFHTLKGWVPWYKYVPTQTCE